MYPPWLHQHLKAFCLSWGAPDVVNEVGGEDGIPTGLITGYSLSGGMYLDKCQKIGVGGRVFGIFQNVQSRTLTSDGSTSLGYPFYNTNPIVNAEDAYLVAFRALVMCQYRQVRLLRELT